MNEIEKALGLPDKKPATQKQLLEAIEKLKQAAAAKAEGETDADTQAARITELSEALAAKDTELSALRTQLAEARASATASDGKFAGERADRVKELVTSVVDSGRLVADQAAEWERKGRETADWTAFVASLKALGPQDPGPKPDDSAASDADAGYKRTHNPDAAANPQKPEFLAKEDAAATDEAAKWKALNTALEAHIKQTGQDFKTAWKTLRELKPELFT
ncbi:MAG: hypothetical protein LBD14_01530 [Puniceicoccales bacterium]|jgi:hypothetical protein|nr:hypothetical protein [Puniceicoccales bacterium]